jgi:glycosyltransferase involved in cell wall biosynthesis
MKAAVVLPSLSRLGGGLTEVARQLAQHLVPFTELELQIFGPRDIFTETDAVTWEPLSVNTFSVVGPRSFGYAPQLIPRMRAAAADLVHCHGLWTYSSLASLNVAARRMPNIISPHGMLDPWALRNSAWKKRLAGILFERSHLHRASCLHALCVPELEAIRKLGLTNPVCLIPSGVELPATADTRDKAALRPQADQRVLLYLGRLHPKKGLHTLMDAWALARTRCPNDAQDWILVVAGWESKAGYERDLRARATSLSIGHTVKFPGPLYGTSKVLALNSANAFVLPSVSEGMPVSILEAWAHKLPVVMTPQCNLADGFDVRAALRIEPSLASITAGLEILFAMSDIERAQMGSNGRRLVERAYTWEKAAQNMRSVYAWLAGGASRPDFVVIK